MSTATFAELFEKSTSSIAEGTVVKGTIVAVKNNQVMVDIGYKAEGLLDIHEFSSPEEATIGTEIEVLFLPRPIRVDKHGWRRICRGFKRPVRKNLLIQAPHHNLAINWIHAGRRNPCPRLKRVRVRF